MSSSPDKNSSHINIKQSEQRLDQELNNITPVIGTVIKSLFDSYNGTGNSANIPIASQLLAALPQLHTVLQNNQQFVSFDNKNEMIQQSIDQFDTLIETPLVQQLLNTINADPDQIKKAVHMHNASIHQRLTAFKPIVNAINHRNEHIIDDILLHPDRLVTILYENSPELVTNFLTKKGFGKEQIENLLKKLSNQ